MWNSFRNYKFHYTFITDTGNGILRQEGSINVSSITAGQSVEVVYQNKDIIGVQVNLLTGKEDYVLHFNPRYSLNILVLNTLLNGTWQAEIRPGGFPFPANYASSRVAVRITAQQLSFAISVNGVPFWQLPWCRGVKLTHCWMILRNRSTSSSQRRKGARTPWMLLNFRPPEDTCFNLMLYNIWPPR